MDWAEEAAREIDKRWPCDVAAIIRKHFAALLFGNSIRYEQFNELVRAARTFQDCDFDSSGRAVIRVRPQEMRNLRHALKPFAEVK